MLRLLRAPGVAKGRHPNWSVRAVAVNYRIIINVKNFYEQQIGRGHVYLEYRKSAKSTAATKYTQVLREKREFITFQGIFFCMYKQMIIIMCPVVIIIMCPCATPLR